MLYSQYKTNENSKDPTDCKPGASCTVSVDFAS